MTVNWSYFQFFLTARPLTSRAEHLGSTHIFRPNKRGLRFCLTVQWIRFCAHSHRITAGDRRYAHSASPSPSRKLSSETVTGDRSRTFTNFRTEIRSTA
ncbi:hypothetical protein L6452_31476 [Arctium lappa]|uniref:Uncharacterized protein n=1 Tax=Arctium lappa TaxID=4217 RepID=A0ACB8Z363_ARCLA|nr:hypothetical protein L6452_31476 [Arctium lappa]